MSFIFRASNKVLTGGKHIPRCIQSTISTDLHSHLILLLEATLISFFTDTWKGTSICQIEVPHICMSVLFTFCFLDDCYLFFFLLVKRCQRSSNLKSSQSEFNIKLATLQPHKLWDWQNDLLRSWIKLPIYSACAISVCCKGTEIWEQWSLNIFDYCVLGLPPL